MLNVEEERVPDSIPKAGSLGLTVRCSCMGPTGSRGTEAARCARGWSPRTLDSTMQGSWLPDQAEPGNCADWECRRDEGCLTLQRTHRPSSLIFFLWRCQTLPFTAVVGDKFLPMSASSAQGETCKAGEGDAQEGGG